MKKALGLFAALALVAAMSVPVFASENHDNNNNDEQASALLNTDDINATALNKDSAVAQDKSIAVNVQSEKDVDVKKTEIKAEDGGIIADDSKVATKGGQVAGDDAIKDSYNKETDIDTDIDHSFNKTETEIRVGDVTVMLANSDLDGEVENNRIEVEHHSELETGDIRNSDGAFKDAAGITVVKQNTGVNSLMQTSINVNATVK